MKTICLWMTLFLFSLTKLVYAESSPIEHLNVSVWSEYKKNNFEGLGGRGRTEILQRIFEDKLQFVQRHQVRRLIVKILDPIAFEFFHPENFDSSRDDNFYYWAAQLRQHVEVEVLFDKGEFSLNVPNYSDKCYGYYHAFTSHFKTSGKPFGSFASLIEKLQWLSQINKSYYEQNQSFLIRGVVVDPQETGDDDVIYQNLINAFDQYRSNASTLLPENVYSELRIGFLLKMDQKDLALVNLARFPLQIDIKSPKPRSLGLSFTSSFPSKGPDYLPPDWRGDQGHPMLDTVYLQMYDPRLIASIYQNLDKIPSPLDYNPEAVECLSTFLGKNFRGMPFVKGPGTISILKGTAAVKGMYTFFKTGNDQTCEGKVIDGQSILIAPPYIATATRKVISGNPENNKTLRTTSPFSTTNDIIEAEYSVTPIPVVWTTPVISPKLVERIYYMFSTEFDPNGGQYFGNWNLQNVLAFLNNPKAQSGFMNQLLFVLPNAKGSPPCNNIVLYDYSTLPNGDPYPECDWGLGNKAP